MKVLHIGQMIGGLDIYIRNSIIYNNVEDNEYVIVCGKDDKHQPVIRNGIEVKEYPISLFRSLNPLNDLKALIEAVKIIKKEKPDVIHCHSAKGGIIGRTAGWITGVKTFYTASCFLIPLYSFEAEAMGIYDHRAIDSFQYIRISMFRIRTGNGNQGGWLF